MLWLATQCNLWVHDQKKPGGWLYFRYQRVIQLLNDGTSSWKWKSTSGSILASSCDLTYIYCVCLESNFFLFFDIINWQLFSIANKKLKPKCWLSSDNQRLPFFSQAVTRTSSKNRPHVDSQLASNFTSWHPLQHNHNGKILLGDQPAVKLDGGCKLVDRKLYNNWTSGAPPDE